MGMCGSLGVAIENFRFQLHARFVDTGYHGSWRMDGLALLDFQCGSLRHSLRRTGGSERDQGSSRLLRRWGWTCSLGGGCIRWHGMCFE